MPLPEPNATVEGAPDVGTLMRYVEIRDQRILRMEADAQRLEAQWQRAFDELNAQHAPCGAKIERIRAETLTLERTLARNRDDITRLQQRISELEAAAERQSAALSEAVGARRASESRLAASSQRITRIEHSNAVLRQTILDLQGVLEQVGAQAVRGQALITRVAELDGNHATT